MCVFEKKILFFFFEFWCEWLYLLDNECNCVFFGREKEGFVNIYKRVYLYLFSLVCDIYSVFLKYYYVFLFSYLVMYVSKLNIYVYCYDIFFFVYNE